MDLTTDKISKFQFFKQILFYINDDSSAYICIYPTKGIYFVPELWVKNILQCYFLIVFGSFSLQKYNFANKYYIIDMQKTHFSFFLALACCFVFVNAKAQNASYEPTPLITSVSQLSSPYSDTQEGKDIGALIDKDNNTFWHSDWHGQTSGNYHWIQIKLDEPTQGLVCLYMHRRNASNDHPTIIKVSGSSNGSSWRELATIDLPYQGFSGVNSEPWVIREPISHLRLTVTDCYGREGTGFRKFWHAAEIQLYHISNEFEYSNDLSGVRINEIHVANIDQFIDNSYNYGGWIELYNTSAELHTLNKARIRHTDADGKAEGETLHMGHGLLKGNGFASLWFDHNSADGNFGGNSHLQIPFKMDPEGGTLELIDANGHIVDRVNYPPSIARCSYARTADGGSEWGWTATPTLNASNNQSVFATDRLEAPVIDKESTLFTGSVSFNVKIPNGSKLRYTTDGSTPTATHGITSSNGSFTTFSTKIFRFVLIADDKLPSQVVTRSFIKDENNLRLPVLSISTHPDNLYDDIIGVYTKGTNGIAGNGQDEPCNWNMDWERPVNVEYLVKEGEEDYKPVLNQEAEFKIAGGWSRAYGAGNGWPMKSSFRLKSGKLYEGKNSFDYPIFAGKKDYNKYKTLQVRNGGNDTYARFKDPALHEIFRSSGFYLDCQAAQPCHVFFNGEYLGMLNIRENNNKHYGESGYGIDTDDIDQFELNGVVGYEQKAGDREAFWQWLTLSKEIAANPNDKKVWEQICQLVDIDEYCNYMAAECYIGSTDWLTNCNNIKGFRSRIDNGKFHMVMFDTDAAFNNYNMIASIHDMLGNNDGRFSDNNGKNYLTEIFFNMMKYEPFKLQFIHAFSIVDGSVMEPERCKKIIDEMEANTKTALSLEGNDPSGSAAWLYNRIANEGDRNTRLNNIKAFFNLTTEHKVKLESNIPEARLLLDGQEIPTRKFDGTVFGPATITAKAPSGYTFQGWNLVSNAAEQQVLIPFKSTWKYYDKGSLDGSNWKEDGVSSTDWKSGKAPFGYGTVGTTANAADYYTTIDYGSDPNKKRPTYYFSKPFTLPEAPTYEDRFYLYYFLDDGALFYVNGTEVGGYHCNSGVSYNDFSTTHESNVAAYGTIEIPASVLQKGRNVISVEVHNTSYTSSDIFFDSKVVKAKFKTNFIANKETISLNEVAADGNCHLTAVYKKEDDPLKLLEAGASPIRINEVSAGNSIYINDYLKRNDWIELYNTTGQDIDISGMYLSDSRNNPQKYRIDASGSGASTIVPAHGKLIVWCDKLDPITQLHAPFKLDNADGAYVSIQAEDGTWADEMEYFAQDRWQTYGRYPDGGHYVSHLNQPTIEKPNMMGTYDFSAENGEEWNNNEMAITLEMVPGWNWVSHNLAEDAHRSRFTGYAQSILGQQDSYVKDSVAGWSGSLSTIQAAAGYKVKMDSQADITLRGKLFDVQKTVSLQQGWNWIGCPLYNTTTIEAALSNYTPTEGDAIIGLDAFATYEDGKWEGTLTSLSPGQAYMMKSGIAQSLCWNSLSAPTSQTRRYKAPVAESSPNSPWTADIHAYPNVSGIIATIEINGTPVINDNYTLGAFCGKECRGVAQFLNGLFYLNIHGEDGETITFNFIDEEGQIHQANQTLSFKAETITGNRKEPLRLTASGASIQAPSSAGSRVVSTAYYNTEGLRISRPASGVYIQKTIYENGRIIVRKITR